MTLPNLEILRSNFSDAVHKDPLLAWLIVSLLDPATLHEGVTTLATSCEPLYPPSGGMGVLVVYRGSWAPPRLDLEARAIYETRRSMQLLVPTLVSGENTITTDEGDHYVAARLTSYVAATSEERLAAAHMFIEAWEAFTWQVATLADVEFDRDSGLWRTAAAHVTAP